METLSAINTPAIAIIILNYNGWKDTIECLESVFHIHYPRYQVVVCDAGSTDQSLKHIIDWADGKVQNSWEEGNPLRSLVWPPFTKPIPYKILQPTSNRSDNKSYDTHPLILIEIGTNLGFGGGNNVGLRYVLDQDTFNYVWILNNDTVVHPNSLDELVARSRKFTNLGLCGSTIFYYFHPEEIQTMGGNTYNKWLAVSKVIRPKKSIMDINKIDENDIELRMDMVHGSAMFASVPMIRDVGLLNEEYFLFSEEIDWAARMRGKYALGYAAKSIVYHKRGHSTGNLVDPMERSLQSDYYNIRSRILFTKKFYPWFLPIVFLGLFGVIFNRLRRKQYDRAKMIFQLMFSHLFRQEINSKVSI